MIPNFQQTEKPNIKLLKELKFHRFLYEIKMYYFHYSIPNKIGSFIDLTIANFIKKKYNFLRANGDHFGNWMYIFLHQMSLDMSPKKKYICLAKRGTINNYWLNYFNNKYLIIIYNPFLRLLLSSFFFSKKLAIDINGYIPFSFYMANIPYKGYKSMEPIDDNFLKKYSLIKNKKIKRDVFSKKPLILFYARSGSWKYSIKTSKRNMSTHNANRIINFLSKNNSIFLVGDTKIIDKEKYNNIFDESDLKELSLSLEEVYLEAKYLIGSMSGGSHLPSLFYNIPTLYIGEGTPPATLGSYYLFPKNLTKKDHFFLISDAELKKFSQEEINNLLSQFIYFSRIEQVKNSESYSFKTFNKGRYQLVVNPIGNIHIYKNYHLKFE